jgi:tRNA/tmRNA/rRNA uracil-C5-methylase (TrmA/RlmC/RlmD family)
MDTEKTVELRIEKVVYPGRGLARLDGYVVFVGGVLDGELVSARIRKRKKNYAEADLAEVIEPSGRRIAPECPLDNICPGCSYQHVGYSAEIELKRSQFRNFLEHDCSLRLPFDLEAVPSPRSLGYRNKISLHSAAGDGKVNLGYVGYDGRTVIDVPACPLAVPEINDFLSGLRCDPDFFGSLTDGKEVVLRYAGATGTYYLVSDRKGRSPISSSISLKHAVEETGIGELKVPLNGFFQVNIPVLNSVVDYVGKVTRQIAPSAFVDAYCGAGPFAIAASEEGVPDVLGIDSDDASIGAAEINCRDRGIDNVSLIDEHAGRILDEALEQVEGADVCVLADPPRRGLGKDVCRALVEKRPAHILYISCAPDKLARDIGKLAETGYELVDAKLFDMFPRTSHFETATLLRYAG